MLDKDLIIHVKDIGKVDSDRLMKRFVVPVLVSNMTIRGEYIETYGRSSDSSWMRDCSQFNATVGQLSDWVASGDEFMFIDDDYAYLTFMVADKKGRDFVKMISDNNALLKATHSQVMLLEQLDKLKEHIHKRAEGTWLRVRDMLRKENLDKGFSSKVLTKRKPGFSHSDRLPITLHSRELIDNDLLSNGGFTSSGGW